MADETETRKVRYEFEGDVSNLKSATQSAIGLLDKMENKFSAMAGSSKVAAGIKNMVANVTSSVKGLAGSKLNINTEGITSSLSGIRSMASSMRGFIDPIISKIQSMKDTAISVSSQMTRLGSTISYAFRRVSTSADSGSESINKNKKATDNLRHSQNLANRSSVQLSRGLQNVGQRADDSWKKLKQLTLEGVNLGDIFKVFSGYEVGKFLAESVQEAVHFTEVLNMFTVAMGESNTVAQEFVDTIQELYGLDPTNIMQYSAMFYQLSSAINAPVEASQSMSLGLTKLTVDLASLFDMPIDQVAKNLTSGMQGMAVAVRKYGMDIRIATLEQTALSLGLEMNIRETSEANRQALRYITMVRQASVATGDFAKTIESPANQMRILKEQVQQLARAIGNLFIPVLQAVLPLINGFIMALRTIINFLATLMGIEIPTFGGMTDAAAGLKDTAGGIGEVGDAAKKTAKDMKNLMAPFDELNVLNEESAKAGAGAGGMGGLGGDYLDPALAEAIKAMDQEFENIRMKANDIRDAILDFLGFDYVDYFNPDTGKWEKKLAWFADKFKENLIAVFPYWEKSITALFDTWPEIVDSFKNLGAAIYNVLVMAITPIIDFIKNLFGQVDWDALLAGIIESIPGWINSLAGWINENAEGLSGLVTALIAVAGAWTIWDTALVPVIDNLLSFIDDIKLVLAGLNPLTVAFYAVIAVFALAYLQFESVRGAVRDLGDTFVMLGTMVAASMTSMWNNVVKPILKNIVDNIKELYQKHLADAIEQFGLFAVAFVDFAATMLSAILGVVTFLTEVFGPNFTAVFNAAADLLTTAIGIIVDLLASLLQTLTGVLKFITGVFQADWKKAWSGILDIFKGVWNGMVSVARGAVNLIIDFVNGVVDAIWSALANVINGIADVINSAAGVVDIELNLGVPDHPPSIPHLATGGVVRRPTVAMIGEGSYDEAVIPLGDSPQLNELVNKIVDAINNNPGGAGGSSSNVIDITLQLDGETIYKNQQKVAASRGHDFGLGRFAR